MKGPIIVLIFSTFCLREVFNSKTVTMEGQISFNELDTSGYTQIGDKNYLIPHDQKLNWYAAAHYCRENGLNLASIENENELLAISAYLVSHGYTASDLFWLSGNDLAAEGKFQWLNTGLPIIYKKFSANQPDNWGGKENCLELWQINRQYVMNDRDCKQISRFICEAPMSKTVTHKVTVPGSENPSSVSYCLKYVKNDDANVDIV